MSVTEQDIEVYGSAVMAENDDPQTNGIGGAIDTSVKMCFEDLTGAHIGANVAVVAHAAGASTNVTVYGRNAAGELISETKALNGSTIVPMTSNTAWNRLLKAVKVTDPDKNAAVIAVGYVHSGTAQAGTTTSLTLAAGASATDNAYQFKVIRIVDGSAAGSLAEITSYNGTSKIANVKPAWSGSIGTPQYSIHDGMMLDSHPAEILTVRRPFYNAAADVASGSARTYYEKMFVKNNHATLALTTAVIKEYSDPTANITFALEQSLDGAGYNGSNYTRQQAPAAGVTAFDSTDKNVYNSQNHSAGSAQGVWLKLSLAAGASANNSYYILRETGQSI